MHRGAAKVSCRLGCHTIAVQPQCTDASCMTGVIVSPETVTGMGWRNLPAQTPGLHCPPKGSVCVPHCPCPAAAHAVAICQSTGSKLPACTFVFFFRTTSPWSHTYTRYTAAQTCSVLTPHSCLQYVRCISQREAGVCLRSCHCFPHSCSLWHSCIYSGDKALLHPVR